MPVPILYVVAGPNGVGKTSAFQQLVPAGTDYINADLIAKKIRKQAGGLNTQELANSQAAEIFNVKIRNRETFAIETNLADVATFKSLIGAQKQCGYRLNLIFLTVDDVDICIKRVAQRVREGGHHVTPGVIRERYINGLHLLGHYKGIFDQLKLLDNTHGPLVVQAELQKGQVIGRHNDLKPWASELLATHQKEAPKKPDSIEAARKLYKSQKGESL